jgi:hypothetical protein
MKRVHYSTWSQNLHVTHYCPTYKPRNMTHKSYFLCKSILPFLRKTRTNEVNARALIIAPDIYRTNIKKNGKSTATKKQSYIFFITCFSHNLFSNNAIGDKLLTSKSNRYILLKYEVSSFHCCPLAYCSLFSISRRV